MRTYGRSCAVIGRCGQHAGPRHGHDRRIPHEEDLGLRRAVVDAVEHGPDLRADGVDALLDACRRRSRCTCPGTGWRRVERATHAIAISVKPMSLPPMPTDTTLTVGVERVELRRVRAGVTACGGVMSSVWAPLQLTSRSGRPKLWAREVRVVVRRAQAPERRVLLQRDQRPGRVGVAQGHVGGDARARGRDRLAGGEDAGARRPRPPP